MTTSPDDRSPPPPGSRPRAVSRRTKRGLYVAILLGSLPILLLIAWVWWQNHNFRPKFDCFVNLQRNFAELAIRRREVVQTTDIYSLTNERSFVECRGCGRPYVYRPFQGPRPSTYAEGVPIRMIAWCPAPCHRDLRSGARIVGTKARHVLGEDGRVRRISETDFQAAVGAGHILSEPAPTQPAKQAPARKRAR
jgi:hypothetical protein